MKSIIMQKLTKTIAALMLAIAVVCAAGCKKHNDGNGSYNGHDYIDLGLPSGTLWATCNVGADTPEGYGDYFAWGETQVKYNYDWNTYHYGGMHHLTKYCSSPSYGYNGFTDNLTTLQPKDDAAKANWGRKWRTPTKEQWQELYNNTTSQWTEQNGVEGRMFTAANGASLFLPATGYRLDRNLYGAGDRGFYWSQSLCTDSPNGAWIFYFLSINCNLIEDMRCQGVSVRPVCEN